MLPDFFISSFFLPDGNNSRYRNVHNTVQNFWLRKTAGRIQDLLTPSMHDWCHGRHKHFGSRIPSSKMQARMPLKHNTPFSFERYRWQTYIPILFHGKSVLKDGNAGNRISSPNGNIDTAFSLWYPQDL